MMERKLAVVESGVVTNLIVVDPGDMATIEHFGGLLLPPDSSVAIGWTYDGANFAEPVVVKTYAEAVTDKTAAINAACAAAITGGFTSSALGDFHRYDSAETDQLNLIGAVSLAVTLPYTCTDSLGSKMPRQHTVSQMRQVMADGAAFKMAQLARCATLKAQIAAALTLADLDAVVW